MTVTDHTQDLLQAAEDTLLFITNRPALVMERGQGMYLWDTEGKRYLDFIGGWAVTCLGHSPEVIQKALTEQSRQLVNASPAFYNRPMIELAELLTRHSCMDKVFFASTGAEANESAIKLARKYGSQELKGAYEIITTTNSFHGRTLATMSATGKAAWKDLFEPKVPGFVHVPFNDIEAVEAAITPSTCAVMLEPVQGEGGAIPSLDEYIQKLRRLCTEKKILLIFDEVQSGIGRTGTLFAYEQYGIEPDIMTLGKGIGGGFPLAAMLTKAQYDIFAPGDQGGTYCGQPLAMAVGLAVVNEVITKKLYENARIQGAYIQQRLAGIQPQFDLRNIRGKGLLIAFDLPQEKGKQIVDACLEQGLIVNSPRPATIRLIPPLIVSKDDIDRMMEILVKMLDDTLIRQETK